jgi:hypothetical protein
MISNRSTVMPAFETLLGEVLSEGEFTTGFRQRANQPISVWSNIKH